MLPLLLLSAAAAASPEPSPRMVAADAPAAVAALAPADVDRSKALAAVRRHLKDDRECLPPPELVLGRPLPRGVATPWGSIEYLKFAQGLYAYRIATDGAGLTTVSVEIRFMDAGGRRLPPDQRGEIAGTLAKAAAVWTDGAPEELRRRVRFAFSAVDRPGDTAFSVHLVPEDVRSLYYYRWSSRISPVSAAHEIGHMMGLNDEYDILSEDSSGCPGSSLMCESGSGRPLPYHYYLILRRAFCARR